jgi:uncharacterized damage-inducible protein DinB
MEPAVEALLQWTRLAHGVMLEEIKGLSTEQLDFAPAPGTNSLGVLVTHVAGSETEIWSMVAGQSFARNRPAEFANRETSAEALAARLAATDRVLAELAAQIDEGRLAASFTRHNTVTRTGLDWLMYSTLHAREHLGHLQLTRQLFPTVFPGLAKAW